MKFGIITNSYKDPQETFLHILIDAIEHKNSSVVFCCDVKDLCNHIFIKNDLICDFTFVLGGDGTVLTSATILAKRGIRIIPVNLGRLGYLSEINIFQIENVLTLLMANDFRIDSRILLNCQSDIEGISSCALNDIVFSHKDVSRLSQFEVRINNCVIDSYKCDGIIISTPTGSTAYSLSAGGPVMAPYAKCLAVTPICPHSLRSKVIVISDDDIVTVKSLSDVDTVCSCDGHNRFPLMQDVAYKVEKCDYSAEFVRFNNRSFFEILKDKLND